MRPETALGVGIGVVVLASLVVAAAVPGAVAGPEEEPGRAFVRDAPSVAVEEVGPDAVTLNVTVPVRHHGGTSENLSVAVRATHLESGLHATTERVEVGPVRGDRELSVPVEVTVPREGGYRIAVELLQDGDRDRVAAREVRGVGDLKPPYARSSVRFHRFDREVGNDTLPAVQASVDDRSDGETTLAVSAYLTNEGGDETADLAVEFVLRRAESGIVVSRSRVPIEAIEAGRTATPSATVTVEDGVNYYVDAILWKDGVIVDSARGVANLDADRAIEVERQQATGGLQVSDAEGADGGAGYAAGGRPTGEPQAVGTQAPGFGPVAALVALLAAAALALARRNP